MCEPFPPELQYVTLPMEWLRFDLVLCLQQWEIFGGSCGEWASAPSEMIRGFQAEEGSCPQILESKLLLVREGQTDLGIQDCYFCLGLIRCSHSKSPCRILEQPVP